MAFLFYFLLFIYLLLFFCWVMALSYHENGFSFTEEAGKNLWSWRISIHSRAQLYGWAKDSTSLKVCKHFWPHEEVSSQFFFKKKIVNKYDLELV